MDDLPDRYRWLNIISNYLGFGLTPSVCICFWLKRQGLGGNLNWQFYAKLSIFCFLRYRLRMDLYFSVSQENLYSRGPYFFIYIFAYFISILYLSLSTIFVSK